MTDPGEDRLRGARGPYRKSEATKNAILDAALVVFAQDGYHKGSLRAIANRVDMSQAGVLRHFPTKEDLLAEVLKRNDTRKEDGYEYPTEGTAILTDMIGRIERDALRPGVVQLYCVLSAEATAPDHPAHEYFLTRYQTLVGVLAVAFDDLRSRGLLREGVESESAARTTIAQMDGLRLQWLLEPERVDIGREVRAFCFSYLVPAAKHQR